MSLAKLNELSDRLLIFSFILHFCKLDFAFWYELFNGNFWIFFFGERKQVHFIIHNDTVLTVTEWKNEAFIEARIYILEMLRTISRMCIHAQWIHLLERWKSGHEHDHKPSSSYCFNRPTEQVRSNRFEILKYQHIECLAENALSFFVIAVGNFWRRDKQLERIINIRVVVSRWHFLLHLLHSLFLMRAKPELLLIAPQHCGPRPYSCVWK